MSDRPVWALVAEFINNIARYQPGRPVDELKHEMNIGGIKPAWNENPPGPWPAAVPAVQGFSTASGAAPQRTR